MNADGLLAQFERVADAPDAIPRLRRLILDLAVRGKLVEQDPNDEPAEELLKRIAVEKVRISRKERTKKPRITQTKTSDTRSELPEGWILTPLSDLVSVLNGRAYKRNELLEVGTPVLRVGNLFTSNKWYYSDLKLDDDKYCEKGDLIFAWSASFGPFIWSGDRVIYHYHIWKLPLHSEANLNKLYLYNFLLQRTQEIKAAGHGISMTHMTKRKMEQVEVPLPPLDEQHRIVAKVDELMALCDQLEAAQAEREATQERLAAASLARLNEPDPETFHDDAHFALNALPALTKRPGQIQQLRRTILNLAVRGKLVEQDPNDEPAEELLMRVTSIRPNKNRRKNLFAEVTENEKSFVCPLGWQWSRFGEVFSIRTGFAFKSSTYSDSGILVLRVVNFDRSGRFDLSDVKFYPEELIDDKIGQFALQEGEILMVMVGGTIGKTTRVGPQILPALLNQNMWRIRSFGKMMSNDFEYLLIRVLNQQIESLTNSTHGHFAMSDYKQKPVCIPPPRRTTPHRRQGG